MIKQNLTLKRMQSNAEANALPKPTHPKIMQVRQILYKTSTKRPEIITKQEH